MDDVVVEELKLRMMFIPHVQALISFLKMKKQKQLFANIWSVLKNIL